MDDDYIWDHCIHGEPNDTWCQECVDEYQSDFDPTEDTDEDKQ